jgi:pimeloyl-ACP methyl ester carboxylesterase
MQTVTSGDGTSIAYEQHGEGPPLVLLHGGSTTRRTWDTLRPHLVEDFSLVIPDRRGRGDSGDADEYGIEREVADLRALLDAVDDDATVFGHSYGGFVALAAAQEMDLDQLVLYEPALLVGEHRDDDLAARMEACLESGDREQAMVLFFQEAAGVAEPERLPIWPEEVNFDLVETVIRENYAIEEYELPDQLKIDASTLLIAGEHGPEHLREGVFTLDEKLSESSLAELDGVGHMAIESAPKRVAAAIRSFTQQ